MWNGALGYVLGLEAAKKTVRKASRIRRGRHRGFHHRSPVSGEYFSFWHKSCLKKKGSFLGNGAGRFTNTLPATECGSPTHCLIVRWRGMFQENGTKHWATAVFFGAIAVFAD